jgi:hypothetical protein
MPCGLFFGSAVVADFAVAVVAIIVFGNGPTASV